jgi:hypothetical protein
MKNVNLAGAGSTWSPPEKDFGLYLEPAGKRLRAPLGARQEKVRALRGARIKDVVAAWNTTTDQAWQG